MHTCIACIYINFAPLDCFQTEVPSFHATHARQSGVTDVVWNYTAAMLIFSFGDEGKDAASAHTTYTTYNMPYLPILEEDFQHCYLSYCLSWPASPIYRFDLRHSSWREVQFLPRGKSGSYSKPWPTAEIDSRLDVDRVESSSMRFKWKIALKCN